MRTTRTSIIAVVIAAVLATVVVGCGAGEDAADATDVTAVPTPPSTSPAAGTTNETIQRSEVTSTIDAGPINLAEEIDLVTTATARLEGTDIEITLVEATGPGEDCADCPLRAVVAVRTEDETTELRYSFSGMMPRDVLDRARRQQAFGYEFLAVRIAEGEMTILVEQLP